MKRILTLFLLTGKLLFAQDLQFVDHSAEMPNTQRCLQVGDRYFIHKTQHSNWFADAYYILDKDLNLIKNVPMGYSKDVRSQINLALANTLYDVTLSYSSKENKVTFSHAKPEVSPEWKEFYTENAKLSKDILEDIYRFWFFITSPDKQKFYFLWRNPLSTTGTYALQEYDANFNLLSKREMAVNEDLYGSHDIPVDFFLDNNDNFIITTYNRDNRKVDVVSYSFKGKANLQKSFTTPLGFCCAKTDFDVASSTLYITYDKDDPEDKPTLDFKEPIAKVITFNVAENKTSETIVTLTPDEIDSLKEAGNLKKNIKYSFRVQSANLRIFENGSYAVLAAMENYVSHHDWGTTAGGNVKVNENELRSTNNIILRVYDKSGNQLAGKSLYRKRKYLNFFDEMNFYMLKNKLYVTCDNRRRDEEEIDDGKKPFNFYRIDENGKVDYIKYRIDRGAKELFFSGGVKSSIIPMTKGGRWGFCAVKIKD